MSAQTAHTPGPWYYKATAGNHDFAVYPEATGRDVALVRDFNEANARLIAKAPELLAALCAFVSTIDATGGAADPTDGDGVAADPDWFDLRLAYEEARRLLTEIEG